MKNFSYFINNSIKKLIFPIETQHLAITLDKFKFFRSSPQEYLAKLDENSKLPAPQLLLVFRKVIQLTEGRSIEDNFKVKKAKRKAIVNM